MDRYITKYKNLKVGHLSITSEPSNEGCIVEDYNPKTREFRAIASVEMVDDYNTILDIDTLSARTATALKWEHDLDGDKKPVGQLTHSQKDMRYGKKALIIDGKIYQGKLGTKNSEYLHNHLSAGTITGTSISFSRTIDSTEEQVKAE